MQASRRRSIIVAVVGVAATSMALAACGGLGVNLKSGTTNPTQVAITASSGVTVNPYPLLVGHTVLFVAHPSAGNSTNYNVTVPVKWDSSNPQSVVLLEPDCVFTHPYAGEQTATICVWANTLGKTTANIDAIASNGALGTIGVSVTN
ncbi:MAG TPA: hypothetical protein VFO25_02150 [Candidatus Eremiobacteraceae bacterium]|nr:hypothetical protein [Candidatus Eremiobacteraceae bacterium]